MVQTVAVIDYGMGNLRSVMTALEHVADKETRVVLTDKPEVANQADRIVFPGQGAAKDCMQALTKSGLGEVMLEAAKNKPFLGICMGQQVLLSHSEENGGTHLLEMFKGEVKRFPELTGDDRLKIPQMGWNTIREVQAHPLFNGVADNSYFYFVHSYYVEPQDPALIAGETVYGVPFASAIAKDNVFAMQCHPEKSADAGLKLLENFLNWDGQA